MQTDKHKLEIMREAARLLRPGGYYAIHEMSLVPDYLRPELKEEIQKDLARTIRVNARPLTVAEWTALAEEAGFEVLDVYQTDMALLEPKRLLADEAPLALRRLRLTWRVSRRFVSVCWYARCVPPSRGPYWRYRSDSA